MFTQSFKATILFGNLIILGIGAYGLVIGPAWFIKAAILLAVLSYVTQAISTVDAKYRDDAALLDACSDPGAKDAKAAAAVWERLAMAMWLATAIIGAYVVGCVVVS